jgi:protein ImuB
MTRNNWANNGIVRKFPENDAFKLIDAVPLVVSDGPEQRPIVYAINRAAHEGGIRIGMTLASAKVLHHDLIALPRDRTRELRTLKRIANFLLQFTPAVAIEENIDRAGIALEVSGSLALFGGFDALLARAREGMRAMRFVTRYGAAPNPMAASLLARAAKRGDDIRVCDSEETLQEKLTPISVKHFAWPNETFRALDTLGLTTIGDVLRQPYAGLQKRFGDTFVLDLDRALGRARDVRRFYEPPETFASSIDFCFEIKESDRLLMPIGELLIELEGFLRARGAGVNRIALELKQGRSRSQHFEFHSRAPVREAMHWQRLVRDRIETYELEDPVIEIVLRADRIVPLIEENASLLPQEKGTRSDWFTLLDRLASRLGEQNVYRIESIDDHRPELAWRSERDEANRAQAFRISKARPTWLLREPKSLIEAEGRPQYNGTLTLLAGPERIDTGWWDNKPVARDYFVAANPQHEICWVFRDYRQGKRWYLHGFFS